MLPFGKNRSVRDDKFLLHRRKDCVDLCLCSYVTQITICVTSVLDEIFSRMNE